MSENEKGAALCKSGPPSRTPSTNTHSTRRRKEPWGYPTTRVDVLEATRGGYLTDRAARELLKRGDPW